MKMATDNLKGEQQRRLEARKNYIEQHLKPLDDFSSMSDGEDCDTSSLNIARDTRLAFQLKSNHSARICINNYKRTRRAATIWNSKSVNKITM